MKITYFLFLLTFYSSIIFGQTTLYPFRVDKKWGLIDSAANVIIEPQFQDVRHLSSGNTEYLGEYSYSENRYYTQVFHPLLYLCLTEFPTNRRYLVVHHGSKGFNFLDVKTKKLICDTFYREVVNFSEGLAAVKSWENWKNWGYIDTTGNIVIPPKYEIANGFKNNKAYVQFDGKAKYINKAGEFIDYMHPLKSTHKAKPVVIDSTKLISFRNYETRKNGYKNIKGDTIVPPYFDEVGHFSKDLARVILYENEPIRGKRVLIKSITVLNPMKMAYINRKGEYIWKEEGFDTLLERAIQNYFKRE